MSYDSKTAKPYVNGEPPKPAPRRKKTANAARDEAIDLVTQNERKAWRELHDKELSRFLVERERATFLAEDFRNWFMAQGNEAPHHPNVWGAMWMARRAARPGGQDRQIPHAAGHALTRAPMHRVEKAQ